MFYSSGMSFFVARLLPFPENLYTLHKERKRKRVIRLSGGTPISSTMQTAIMQISATATRFVLISLQIHFARGACNPHF